MTVNQTTIGNASFKKVPIQERSFTLGSITGVNGFRANRTLLKQRLTEGGYQLHETPHFVLCTREEPPTTILVHWFSPEAIDADIGHSFLQELKPYGLLTHPHGFGEVFGAIVCSLFPRDPQRALHLYGTNTLRRYQYLLTDGRNKVLSADSTINAFALVYRRVSQLLVGERFLDAGCSFGFLPLLIAEQCPFLTQVVGVDIQTDSFPTACALAAEQHLHNVHFAQANLLADDVCTLGHFDTVTALHVLEHFTEAEMYQALASLLKVTSQRLILAVPYEPGEPESAYGHEQLFSRAKLETIGRWCREHIGGAGRMWVEDCAGGLLVVERPKA